MALAFSPIELSLFIEDYAVEVPTSPLSTMYVLSDRATAKFLMGFLKQLLSMDD